MALVRRLLLVFVLLLLVVDGGLLAFVWFAGPAASKPVNLVAFIPKAETAKKVEDALKGYQVATSKEKRDDTVPHGFVVLKHYDDEDVAKGIADTLKIKKVKDVKVVGDAVQVGPIFDSEAKARKVADGLQQKESIQFDVEQGEKKVTVEGTKLVVKGLDSAAVDKVKEIFNQNGVEDYESQPAAPAAEAG